MILVKTTDQYLYDLKRDILVLQMRSKSSPDLLFIDGELCEDAAQSQLEWFKERGINSRHTCSPGMAIGWDGKFYIDVDPSDSVVSDYSLEWETPDGKSLKPEEYQMCMISYQEWVDSGGLERHKQHLKDLEDPDWCP